MKVNFKSNKEETIFSFEKEDRNGFFKFVPFILAGIILGIIVSGGFHKDTKEEKTPEVEPVPMQESISDQKEIPEHFTEIMIALTTPIIPLVATLYCGKLVREKEALKRKMKEKQEVLDEEMRELTEETVRVTRTIPNDIITKRLWKFKGTYENFASLLKAIQNEEIKTKLQIGDTYHIKNECIGGYDRDGDNIKAGDCITCVDVARCASSEGWKILMKYSDKMQLNKKSDKKYYKTLHELFDNSISEFFSIPEVSRYISNTYAGGYYHYLYPDYEDIVDGVKEMYGYSEEYLLESYYKQLRHGL